MNKLKLQFGIKPRKPMRPSKPKPPPETISVHKKLYQFAEQDRVPLDAINNLMPDDVKLKDCYIMVDCCSFNEHYYDSSEFSAGIYYDEETPNPYLKRQTTAYEKRLIKYKENYKEYKKKLAEWKKENEAYKELIELSKGLEDLDPSELRRILDMRSKR